MAACVNIIPGIISVYEWENKINHDDEVLMMIKTRELLQNRGPDIFQLILGIFLCFVFFGMASALEAATTTELACDVEAAVTSVASKASGFCLHNLC